MQTRPKPCLYHLLGGFETRTGYAPQSRLPGTSAAGQKLIQHLAKLAIPANDSNKPHQSKSSHILIPQLVLE